MRLFILKYILEILSQFKLNFIVNLLKLIRYLDKWDSHNLVSYSYNPTKL